MATTPPDPTVAMFGKLFEKVDDLAKLIAGRPPRQHLNHPIVPAAKWRIDCACGFARDSAAMTAQMALDEVGRDHDPRHREYLTVDAVDYAEHPLHKGRSTKVPRVIRALVLGLLALTSPAWAQTGPVPGTGGGGGTTVVNSGTTTNITGYLVGDGATITGQAVPIPVADGGTATTSVTNNRFLKMSSLLGVATVSAGLLSDNGSNATLASGAWLVPDGTTAAPSYSWTNAPNAGWYYDAGNTVARFAFGGVGQIAVSSATVTLTNALPLGSGGTATTATTNQHFLMRIASLSGANVYTSSLLYDNGTDVTQVSGTTRLVRLGVGVPASATYQLSVPQSGYFLNDNGGTMFAGTGNIEASDFLIRGGALAGGIRFNATGLITYDPSGLIGWPAAAGGTTRDAGVSRASVSRVNIGDGAGAGYAVASGTISNGVGFGGLDGTLPNGTIIYCDTCNKATPCTSGGTGAFAKRRAGVWDCD